VREREYVCERERERRHHLYSPLGVHVILIYNYT